MAESDWTGCMREARALGATSRALQLLFTCAGRASAATAENAACTQHEALFPTHPFSRACRQIINAHNLP